MLLDPLRDPQQEVPVGICPICNRKVWPGDPAVKTRPRLALPTLIAQSRKIRKILISQKKWRN